MQQQLFGLSGQNIVQFSARHLLKMSGRDFKSFLSCHQYQMGRAAGENGFLVEKCAESVQMKMRTFWPNGTTPVITELKFQLISTTLITRIHYDNEK